tara:strand:- start:489 stop:881 length:393 start_codon:yes stop_codon:yes gene_type:complete
VAKAKKDLGTKLSCQSCGAKFYDLKKKAPVCPKCDEAYVTVKPKTRRAAVKAVAEPAKAATEKTASETPANDDAPKTEEEAIQEVEVEVEDDDNDSDKSLMEDTSDIGTDEDDVAGVIENIDTSKEAKDT